MTKRELIASLERFGDDQTVFVCLFTKHEPNGSQVIIQGVASVLPWHDGKDDGSADLAGLVAHDRNTLLPLAGKETWRSYQPAFDCVESWEQRPRVARFTAALQARLDRIADDHI